MLGLLAGAAVAVGAGYAWWRKDHPAPAVKPANPLPPPGVLNPPVPSGGGTAPAAPAAAPASGIISLPPIINQALGGGVSESTTIDAATGDVLDVLTGGDIGQGETDSNMTGTSTGDIGDVTTPDDGS